MEPAELRERLRTARVGRLATVGADGSPHVVPICFALLDTDGRDAAGPGGAGGTIVSAVDHKPKTTTRLRRLANVTATGRASLLVDAYDEDWSRLWWVRVDGAARVVSALADLTPLTAKYPQYAQRPPAGPYLELDVERWRGWSAM